MRSTKSALLAISVILATTSVPAHAANIADYFSGCLSSMGAAIAGTAVAGSMIQNDDPSAKITTNGYAIAGVISCVSGAVYVGLGGSSATFESSHKLRVENEDLVYQLRRLSKERCLLSGSCRPGSRAIVVDGPTEIRKQGDKVFETTTSTIEAVE
jgi:hypothetical protein